MAIPVSYNARSVVAAEEGLSGTEGCRVQAWVEDEMLALTWNAPPRFATVRGSRTFVVLQFLDAEPGGTLVRVTHGGFAGRRWLTWGLERLMRLIEEGHLHPPDIEVIPFEEISSGLERLARREVDGKLVANLRWR